MKNKLTVTVATLVAISSLGLKAQEITTEQYWGLKLLAQDAQTALEESQRKAAEAYAKLSPEERIVRQILLEKQMEDFEKIRAIITPPEVNPQMLIEARRKRLLNTSTKTTTATAISTASVAKTASITGDGGIQQLSFGGCGADPNQFYNVPLFDAATPPQWQTENAPTTYYPWGFYAPNTIDSSGRKAIRSGIFSANFSSSPLYYILTNNWDTYGVPLNHRLTFKYMFTKSATADTFRLQVGSLLTNLPVSSSWTQVSFVIPPFHRTQTNAQVTFTVFKQSTLSSSPRADLYAVQWCTEVRPDDRTLSVKRAGGSVEVSWSNESCPTDYWNLMFSPIMNTNEVFWSTNIGTSPVVYSNRAIVTFPASDSERYYRLKRNF